jgi:rhodanese-related sulfurtransferase
MRKGYCVCLIAFFALFIAAQGCSSKKASPVNQTAEKTPLTKITPVKPTVEASSDTAQKCPPANQASEEKYMSEKTPVSKPAPEDSNSGVKIDTPAEKVQSAPATVIDLTSDQLRSMIANKEDIVILDVRTPEELTTWPVALDKAVSIPLQELPARYSELPRGKKIVAVCRSGHRSTVAADFLIKAGFNKVYSLAGGMTAFRQSEN